MKKKQTIQSHRDAEILREKQRKKEEAANGGTSK